MSGILLDATEQSFMSVYLSWFQMKFSSLSSCKTQPLACQMLIKHGKVQACRTGSYMVIHSFSLWGLCVKQFSVVVFIYKNKTLVELGLVEHFHFVLFSKVVLHDLVGWNNLQGFLSICTRLRICCSNYYRKFVNLG